MEISEATHAGCSKWQWMIAFLWISLAIPTPVSKSKEVSFTGGASRQRTSFDFNWRFHLGDVPGAQTLDYKDGGWRKLDLPHDWSVELPFNPHYASGTGYLPGGIGWYRKNFDVPEEWRGREVFVEFDGVQRDSDVWINGKHLGHRPNGYISFEYRLTPHLRYGEKNVMSVRVAHENVADSRWYPGTGIFRHTWLTVTNPVRVAHWGVLVTTPRVTAQRADVMVAIKAINGMTEAAPCGSSAKSSIPQARPFLGSRLMQLSQPAEKRILPTGMSRWIRRVGRSTRQCSIRR